MSRRSLLYARSQHQTKHTPQFKTMNQASVCNPFLFSLNIKFHFQKKNYELVTKHQLARHRKTCNSLSNLQVKLQWKAHFSLEPNLAIRVASEPLKSPTVIMRLFYEPSYNPIANPIADPALLNPLLTSKILMVFWMSTLFPLGMKEFNSTQFVGRDGSPKLSYSSQTMTCMSTFRAARCYTRRVKPSAPRESWYKHQMVRTRLMTDSVG